MFKGLSVELVIPHLLMIYLAVIAIAPSRYLKRGYQWYLQILITEWVSLFIVIGIIASQFHASYIWFSAYLLSLLSLRTVKVLRDSKSFKKKAINLFELALKFGLTLKALIQNLIPFTLSPALKSFQLSDRNLTHDISINESHKAICVHIHGGAWKHGNAQQLNFISKFFLSRKIGFISINYQKYPDVDMFDIISKIESTFKEIVDTYGQNRKIILYGRSAGGYLALHLTNRFPKVVSHTVALYPVTSFSFLFNQKERDLLNSHELVNDLLGSKLDRYSELDLDYKNLNENHSLLLVHGNNDPVVNVIHSEDAFIRIKAKGSRITLLKYKIATHGFDFAWNGYTMQSFRSHLHDFIDKV